MTQPGPLWVMMSQADHDLRTSFYRGCIFLWGWTHQVLARHLAPLLLWVGSGVTRGEAGGVCISKYHRNTLFWSFHSRDKYLGWHSDMTLGLRHCSEVCVGVMRDSGVNIVSTVTHHRQHQHHCLAARGHGTQSFTISLTLLFSCHKVLIYTK